jgi:hypothetical protein
MLSSSSIKMKKTKNTTLSDQFQSSLSKTQKEAESIQPTSKGTSMKSGGVRLVLWTETYSSKYWKVIINNTNNPNLSQAKI